MNFHFGCVLCAQGSYVDVVLFPRGLRMRTIVSETIIGQLSVPNICSLSTLVEARTDYRRQEKIIAVAVHYMLENENVVLVNY